LGEAPAAFHRRDHSPTEGVLQEFGVDGSVPSHPLLRRPPPIIGPLSRPGKHSCQPSKRTPSGLRQPRHCEDSSSIPYLGCINVFDSTLVPPPTIHFEGLSSLRMSIRGTRNCIKQISVSIWLVPFVRSTTMPHTLPSRGILECASSPQIAG
jgi:hypothetical protein